MSLIDTYPMMSSTRPRRAPAFELAVLIEVPKARVPKVRREAMTPSREGWRQTSVRRSRPRRRLRRGVRLAGWSLLALLPILSGGALGWASLASRAVDLPAWSEVAEAAVRDQDGTEELIGSSRKVIEPVEASIDAPAVLVKSIEPVIGSPVADTEVPVIFPGYVLPDDSLEEPAHEGS